GITGDDYLQPAALASGFHAALLIAAGTCAAGGVLAALTIRNPGPQMPVGGVECWHCAVDAPPAEVPFATAGDPGR
ncbi:MAG TPA: hypothetical protein VMU14_00595, partial [Acidimicrobiales bacterium]|nr:hypothetical protein [Acidimicrobiales bacterium]